MEARRLLAARQRPDVPARGRRLLHRPDRRRHPRPRVRLHRDVRDQAVGRSVGVRPRPDRRQARDAGGGADRVVRLLHDPGVLPGVDPDRLVRAARRARPVRGQHAPEAAARRPQLAGPALLQLVPQLEPDRRARRPPPGGLAGGERGLVVRHRRRRLGRAAGQGHRARAVRARPRGPDRGRPADRRRGAAAVEPEARRLRGDRVGRQARPLQRPDRRRPEARHVRQEHPAVALRAGQAHRHALHLQRPADVRDRAAGRPAHLAVDHVRLGDLGAHLLPDRALHRDRRQRRPEGLRGAGAGRGRHQRRRRRGDLRRGDLVRRRGLHHRLDRLRRHVPDRRVPAHHGLRLPELRDLGGRRVPHGRSAPGPRRAARRVPAGDAVVPARRHLDAGGRLRADHGRGPGDLGAAAAVRVGQRRRRPQEPARARRALRPRVERRGHGAGALDRRAAGGAGQRGRPADPLRRRHRARCPSRPTRRSRSSSASASTTSSVSAPGRRRRWATRSPAS